MGTTPSTTRALRYLFASALLLGLVLQATLLWNSYSFRITEIYHSMGQPGLWRSANFTFGQRVANFYAFLNQHVPLDATVLVPARTQSPVPLMQQAYVEFFTQPRSFDYCENTPQFCIEQNQSEPVAIILTDLQQIDTSENWASRILAFDEDWGILLPSTAGAANPWQPYSSFAGIVGSSLLAMLFLLALILPWTLVARHTLPDEHGLLHFALGIGSGTAWLSLSLCIALLAGAQLSTGFILILAAGGWAIWGAVSLYRRVSWSLKRPQLTIKEWGAVAGLLVPVAMAFVLSVGNGFTETDELILWGSKGYGIFGFGLQEGATGRGTLGTWYPLNVPLLVTSFMQLFGERLPESKVVFPLFLLASSIFVFLFLRRFTQTWVAALCAALLSTAPSLFYMSTLAHANAPLVFYLLAASVLLHLSGQKTGKRSIIYWLWGTLALVFGAWTRPEGLHLAWAVAVTAAIIYRNDIRQQPTKLYLSLAALGLYTLFWLLFSPHIYYSPGSTDSAFSNAFFGILQGDLRIREGLYLVWSLLTGFLQPSTWGAIGLIALLCTGLVFFNKQSKQFADIFWMGVVVLAAITGGFWANSYTAYQNMDLSMWVSTAYIRLASPGFAILWLYLIARTAVHLFPKKQG
ncbi:MAG: glycosyltransferase family 39 protein [Anaerolineales bacterium]|nr:glycosyltransferase family 39 protein [Anaerolineales bacterium]